MQKGEQKECIKFAHILKFMHQKQLSISDFTYSLPNERIAKYPLENRDSSKLLVYKSGEITSSIYREIHTFLPEDTLLIFNDTKVVEARLLFKKPTGATIELFCLEPSDEYADITSVMLQTGSVKWKCLIGGASKWKQGVQLLKVIETPNGGIIHLEASIKERLPDCFVVELSWKPGDISFAEMLHLAGCIPLPPYLHRDAEESDKTRYQTIYAKQDGSVAAPTAGLHFTDNVFKELARKNIAKSFVTLHVGAGTFKPVKGESLGEHDMHTEFMDVQLEVIENMIMYLNKNIVAVGTTSLRTIESLYWMGLKANLDENITLEDLSITQWEVYEITYRISAKESLNSLCKWMRKNNLTRLINKTQILIAPGYQLKIAKGIITNFHQPQSTLLLLIAAFVGDKWKEIYQYALDNEFRFLSYGDGCLLWKK